MLNNEEKQGEPRNTGPQRKRPTPLSRLGVPASPSNRFSDPSQDFQDEESQKILLRISSTPVSQLSAFDYIVIFQSFCPPGTVSETLPYIAPAFKFIKREFFQEDWSAISTIWGNFTLWMRDNIKEIEKLQYKRAIDYEINNLFLYLGEYGCDVDKTSLYAVSNRIADAIGTYIWSMAPPQDRNIFAVSAIAYFQKSPLLQKLIILQLFLNAREYENCMQSKEAAFILDTYGKQEMRLMLNEIMEAALEWDSVPSDLEQFIADCELHLTCGLQQGKT